MNIEEILKEQFHLLDTKIQTTQDVIKAGLDDKQNQINQLRAKVESWERKLEEFKQSLAEVRDRK